MIKIVYQIVLFAVVGLSATFVHTVIFSLLASVEFSPLVANFTAFCCALPVSFYGNRYLTFKAEGSLTKFAAMSVCGFMMNHINVWIVTDIQKMDWKYALPGMLIVVPMFSFIISKLWVYRR